MAEYYGGAPNAFMGGVEFGASQRKRKLHENALAALIERYGPEAADPQSLASLQRTEQSAELHPYALSGAKRQDAAQEEMVDQYGPTGDPAVQERERALKLQAAKRAAQVFAVTKQRGGDLGGAFDLVQELLPAIGVPADQMPALREAVMTDPDTVDELIAFLNDPDSAANKNKAMSAPVSVYDKASGEYKLIQPMADGSYVELDGLSAATAEQGAQRLGQGAERIQTAWKKLSLEEAKMEGYDAPPGFQIWRAPDGTIQSIPIAGSEQETALDKDQTDLETSDRKFIGISGTISSNAAIVYREANRALSYFADAGGGVFKRSLRMGTKFVPGLKSNDADDAIKEIKSKVSLDALQQMRQNSPTGGAMGNISDRDIAILESALGRLEVTRDPKRMVEDINYIVSEYGRILGLAREDEARAKKRIAERKQRGTPQPPARSAAPADDPELDELLNQYAPVTQQ